MRNAKMVRVNQLEVLTNIPPKDLVKIIDFHLLKARARKQPKICTICGTSNYPDSLKCDDCGYDLYEGEK